MEHTPLSKEAEAVFAALRGRRSIRKYTDEPVTDQELAAILDAGRWAPSGLNNQPWRFLVVRRGDPRQGIMAAHTKYGRIVQGAAALIMVLLDRAAIYNERKDHQGAGACIQNMLLAVHALGLGGVWLGEIINNEAALLPALGLDPAAHEMMAVIALGRPAQKGSSDRKPLETLMLEQIQP